MWPTDSTLSAGTRALTACILRKFCCYLGCHPSLPNVPRVSRYRPGSGRYLIHVLYGHFFSGEFRIGAEIDERAGSGRTGSDTLNGPAQKGPRPEKNHQTRCSPGIIGKFLEFFFGGGDLRCEILDWRQRSDGPPKSSTNSYRRWFRLTQSVQGFET